MDGAGSVEEYAKASRLAWRLSLASYAVWHLVGTFAGSGYYARPLEDRNMLAIFMTAMSFMIMSHMWMYRLILRRRILAGRSDLIMPVNTSEFGEEGDQKWPAVTVMAILFNMLIIGCILVGRVGD